MRRLEQAGPAATAVAMGEMFHSRHDVSGGNDVESAVRVAGGIPTLGGGLRASRRSSGRRGARV
jgi:hypothetical protein